MAMSEYSLSDIATASRENGFGGDTAWCMIILFAMIFGWGGNGFGFGNRGPASEPVTEAGLCNAMNFNGLENAVGRLSDQQAAIARQNDNAICSLGYQTLEQSSKLGATVQNGFNQMQSQLADCCCTTQRGIDSVNYNGAINTAAIQQTVTEQTQKGPRHHHRQPHGRHAEPDQPAPAVPGALRSGALPEHLRLQRRPEPVLR